MILVKARIRSGKPKKFRPRMSSPLGSVKSKNGKRYMKTEKGWRVMKSIRLVVSVLAKSNGFKRLQKYKVPLTEDERAECMRRKAVWHFHIGRDKKHHATPAVWKSKHPKTGKVTYVTNTHRAYNTAPTLKGAISRFHKFIKGTA